jgi:inner membrane protein
MQFKTHLAFSLLIGLLLVYFGIAKTTILFFATVLFFSLLPDIDTPESFFGRITKPFSILINKIAGHRTIFHSVWVPILLSFVLFGFSPLIAFAAFVGYSSHLLLDIFSDRGLLPFYPLKFHVSGPFRTGGFLEVVLFFVLVATDSLLVLNIFF